ncbi:SGNH/GDSL hydrolase family protein [uncultured Jatrophihabitans sp.]|uniref:SGNH/GDSL hydrolase family protein n=1 Tax=uncultured Jatrophihabitans sp. TaxID=1610747 RepID=UPI0035CBD16B
MSDADFEYSNLSGRSRGAFLTLAGRVLPGITRVHQDVAPFAEAWRRDNLAALAGDRPLWVALGDSLTQGIGAPSHDRGWVGQVRDRLAAQGFDYAVLNLGVSGATTRDVLDRQLPALASVSARPVHPPIALVTLMIGSNDLLRPANRRLLPARLGEVLEALPRGAIVTTMPNPSAAARRANEVLLGIAPGRGLVVAELRDPRTSSWRGKLAADHFHPNERGYAALADVVGDVVVSAARAA